ncbi:ABC transporter ATP-binding protein [Horticoccus luteus]|uniref:ABC transporter ATP-binding protein n=1 Tax=Horticoccus luteus TaxID=2862869 RepID=A0A8F9XMQ0_9BACT|nr:ABC transporter ATP-binding protein [Horticoccus luteus]QYM80501.1 ABC transporter ATP-binding protein [Horticoccus luteus]
MSRPIIEVRNLSKRYRLGAIGATSLREEAARYWDRLRGVPHPDKADFWALKDVSFDVQPGEVVGIIGRNGAGKSTLLKILSRITEPTSGSARLRGRVASLLEVGTGFHPELTGRENIFLNGAILGMSRAEVRRKFDEIVAFAEVEQFIDTPVKRYSSGMYVRLAFAVAAHLEPDILIVDEVLAVGDVAFQKKCLARMRVISTEERRTVLFVTHNLNSVMQLCTHALLFEGGRILADGKPADIVQRYFGANRTNDVTVDLTRIIRTGNLRNKARLLSVRMGEACSPAAWQFPFGTRIALEFKIQVAQRLETLEIGLGLFNLHGFEVCSSLSSWSKRHGPLEPGDYLMAVVYPELQVVPGPYCFGIGLRSERGSEDYVREALDIEVIDSPQSARENFSTIQGVLAVDISTTITRTPDSI